MTNTIQIIIGSVSISAAATPASIGTMVVGSTFTIA